MATDSKVFRRICTTISIAQSPTMSPTIGADMRMDYDDAIDEMLLVVDGAAVICGLLQDHPSDTALEVVRVALRKVADDTAAARQEKPHQP